MPGAIVEEEKSQIESIKEQLKLEKEDYVFVEIVKDGDEEDDEDDEDDEDFGGEEEGGNEYSKPSRSEKKSRKALLKLGMKPISDVSSVEFRRAKNVFYVISNPVVYKSPNADTYVFFGEAKLDDLSSQLQTQAAQRFKTLDMTSMLPNDASQASMAPLAEEEDEDDVDDGGFEAGDIDIVMTQAGISKAKAVKALKANDGDIVSAIMELTP
ncbi:PREDICTED: nascent polypeptide-associated complex subunit alpha-like protein 5 [Camelina sativa]|uniref:Nascent polypeptide-associated complex subunit alpha-like protein 5 n=1 Tax=Camelina sativa TaxID=90675 RepID=A0ABM0VU40_CAMSA|nr:PREDICTED: nascent polypeptide-associated complex subunit alpha-like protein 5 [Camelina sativa]